MLKNLYLAFEQKLMAINDEKGQSLFKHFDLWNRQVEFTLISLNNQSLKTCIQNDTIIYEKSHIG